MEFNCNRQLTTITGNFSLCRGHLSYCAKIATKLFNLSHCGRIPVVWIKAEPQSPFPATAFICSHFDFTLASLARI
jgi:hypothetical protein